MYSYLYRPEHGRDGLRAFDVLWRTIWRISLEYHTLGWFSDIAKLQKKDVDYKSNPSPHLKILFKGGKNDQYSEGSERIVASNPDHKICPVKLTINYFQFLGLTFTMGIYGPFLYTKENTKSKQGCIIKRSSFGPEKTDVYVGV